MTLPGRRGVAGRAVGGALALWLVGLLFVAFGQHRSLPPGWVVASAARPAAAVGDRVDPPDPRRWRIEALRRVELPAGARSLGLAAWLDADDVLEIEVGGPRLGLRAGDPLRVEGGACDAPPTPVSAHPDIRVALDDAALTLSVDGQVTRCTGAVAPLALAASSGRVHFGAVVVDGERLPGPVIAPAAVVGLLGGLLLGAAVGGWLGRSLWLWVPGLLLGSAGAGVDPALLAERLRLTALATPGSAALAGALLAVFGAGVATCWVAVGSRSASPASASPASAPPASAPPASASSAASARLLGSPRLLGMLLSWLGLLLALAWGPLAVVRVRTTGPAAIGRLALATGLGLATLALARAAVARLTPSGPATAGPAAADAATAARVSAAVVGLGTLAAALGLAAGLVPPLAMVGLALSGAGISGILWANRNAVPGFNGLSLLLAALAFIGLEVAVAHTRTAAGWRAAESWADRSRALAAAQIAVFDDPVDAAGASFAAFEQARPTVYPSRGYPVAFGPRRAPLRVVAFGGSSTGGAYQFDDLSVFYPARLDALLGPDVEVLNQGVGGWTSFHIARYAQQRLADLDPDVVTLYAGNNDSARGYPATLAELHARWSSAAHPGPLAGLLGRLSVVRWLRQLRSAPATSGGQPAVRPDELAANLAMLLRACRERSADLVLLAEANVDDNPDLLPYRDAMATLAAAESDVHYLDANAILSGHDALFLDTVHLSSAGHQRLAEALAEFMRAQGLVPTAVQP